jgi:hypothetical protein
MRNCCTGCQQSIAHLAEIDRIVLACEGAELGPRGAHKHVCGMLLLLLMLLSVPYGSCTCGSTRSCTGSSMQNMSHAWLPHCCGWVTQHCAQCRENDEADCN